MAEADNNIAELPLDGAGAQLRRAREAAGLSFGDMAARTKIAERHLASIEDGNYGALASRTYAVGFSRSYARALGLDEHLIADAVRSDLAAVDFGDDRRGVSAFEPGDPARVPSARLAWLAAAGGLAILLIGIVFLWRSFYAPGAELPGPAAPASPAPAVAASPVAPVTQGTVVFTALEPDVWVKFYDAAGVQLMQKQMALGESYTVPAGVNGPMLWTARPDALQIAVDGRLLPKLSDTQQTMKDVPVTAAALLARQAAAPPAAVPVSAIPAPLGALPAAGAPAQQPRPVAVRAAQPARPPASASPATAVSPSVEPAVAAPSPPAPSVQPAAVVQQPSTVSQ